MTTISRALQQLHDTEARIPQTQISAGATSHRYLADVLKNRRQRDPNFPWIVETMLSGSYIRGTKIAPLDDIDMLVILDGKGMYEYNGSYVTSGVVRGVEDDSPAHKLTGLYGMICSRRLLDCFRASIAETYPTSTKVRKDGQAVNIQFRSGIGLDVVPCFEIYPANGNREYFYIPAGGAGGWLTTNPRIDREVSDELHDFHNKLLRPVVRLVKLWNTERNAGRLKSYHLEVLVWRALGGHLPIYDLQSGLTRFFTAAPELVLRQCTDPTGLGGPIDGYLSQEARQASFVAVQAAQQELRRNPFVGTDHWVAWGRIFNRSLERLSA